MNKIKVSAVSFINSYPFIYGLENTPVKNKIELFLDTPAQCANKLLNNDVDIGLIPVSEIPKLKYNEIISDFCLGSKYNVRTVLLISQFPIREIKTIYLDEQSRTSNNLIKILTTKYWKINPEFKNPISDLQKIDFTKKIGVVVIGDKAFGIENNYKYKYDLADEWFNFTSLPFVFACWVANKKIESEFKENFSKSLEFGIKNITHLINSNYKNIKSVNNIDSYYRKNLDYNLDEKKKEAVKLFWNYLKKNKKSSEHGFC